MWRDGLWLKLWDMGVKGRMWCVIKKMYGASRSRVHLEGEKSAMFSVEQDVAQGCSLSPILFLLKDVEQAEFGQLESARRLLLLSVIRPSIEYRGEVWEGNKSQVDALESIILGGAKRNLGCSSKTCNEAVRGDMGLETLKSRRDRAKLKWWYK